MRIILPTDVEFQVPMDGKYVSLIRKSIRSLAVERCYNEFDCQDVEVAVGEAVTNAISYGRAQDGGGFVRVRCRVTPSNLIVEVEDEGKATCLPILKAAPGAGNEHGRGLILIHRLMDRVSVRCTDRGLLVRMVKCRRFSVAYKRELRRLPTVA